MTGFTLEALASANIEDIYRYTAAHWGDAQAESYSRGLFDMFRQIVDRRIAWRSLPAEIGVEGYQVRYRSHVIYWRIRTDGNIGVVAILHDRMHQIDRLQYAFGLGQ